MQLPSPKRPQLHQPPSQSRHNLTELGQWSAEDTQSGLRSRPCILRASSCQSWHYHLFPRAGQLLATRLALHICCAFNVHDGNPRAHFDCQQGSTLLYKNDLTSFLLSGVSNPSQEYGLLAAVSSRLLDVVCLCLLLPHHQAVRSPLHHLIRRGGEMLKVRVALAPHAAMQMIGAYKCRTQSWYVGHITSS